MSIRKVRHRFYKKQGGPRQIGNRCKVYCAGCIVCDFHRFKDENGRFPYTFEEAFEYSQQMTRLEDGRQ